MKTHTHFTPFLIWSIVSLLYGLEFFIRISPNMMLPVLQDELSLSYTQLGEVSAIFYCSYAIFQIPLTLAALKFGIKKVFTALTILFISGLLLFASSETYNSFFLARALMGLGASITFTVLLDLARVWFPPQSFGFYVGLANTFGTLGAVAASYPLEWWLMHYSWRGLLKGCSIFAALLLLFFLCFYADRPVGAERPTYDRKTLSNEWGFLGVLVLVGFAMVLPIVILPELWGSLVMEHWHHVDVSDGAWALSFFFIGTGTGSLLKGAFSLSLSTLTLLRRAIIVEAIGLVLFIANPFGHVLGLGFSCFVIGFSASFMLLLFSLVQQHFNEPVLPTAVLNVSVILLSVMAQPLMGYYLDISPSLGLSLEGALKIALLILPLVLIPTYTVSYRLTLS